MKKVLSLAVLICIASLVVSVYAMWQQTITGKWFIPKQPLAPPPSPPSLVAVIQYSVDNVTYSEDIDYTLEEPLYARLYITEITGLTKINITWGIVKATDIANPTWELPHDYIQLNVLLTTPPQTIYCPTEWSPYINSTDNYRVDAVVWRD